MRVTRLATGLVLARASLQALPALSHHWLVARHRAPWLAGIGDPASLALTFDDGPDPASTPLVLDELDRQGIRATFFLLGEMVDRHPWLAAEVRERGHELGTHGYWHRSHLARSGRSVAFDLKRSLAAIEDATGTRPTWIRPPYGVATRATLQAAHAEGLRLVLWTTWGRDWRRMATPTSVMADLRYRLVPGATLLLHDSDSTSYPGSFRTALAAIEPLADLARAQGLAFRRLSEHGL